MVAPSSSVSEAAEGSVADRLPSILRQSTAKSISSVEEFGNRKMSRGETGSSIRFAAQATLLEYRPEDSPDIPEFVSEEERARAIAAAESLALEALTREEAKPLKVAALCGSCCDLVDVLDAGSDGEDLDATPEDLEALSSRKLNEQAERRASRRLSRGPSIVREDSKCVRAGTVSFCSFLTGSSRVNDVDSSVPQPLAAFLPPSPFMSKDGKLAVDCKGFKIDFTDALSNIVPPFFMTQRDSQDKRIQEVMKKGVSYAKEIDMFGPEDLEALFQDPEPSSAHKDLMDSAQTTTCAPTPAQPAQA